MARRIGLTGGIGSGKSLVGDILRELGVPVIDTDHIVHALFQEDPDVKSAVRRHFGEAVFDEAGAVDRKRLGQIVFADSGARTQLESWLHPKVRQEVARFFEAHHAEPVAAALVPLLFETGIQGHYDETWLVVASPEQQIERVMKTRGMTRDEVLRRMTSQMSLEEKALLADRQIDNTGTPQQTREQVKALLKVCGVAGA